VVQKKPDAVAIVAKQEKAFKSRKTEMMVSRAKRITAEEQELCDKPVINSTSKALAAKRTKNIPIQARYEEELRQKEAKLMKLKSQIEQAKQSQQDECTFYPKLGRSRSRSFRVERPNLVDPTLAFQQKQQKLAQLKLDYLVEESQNLTFKPHINKKSSEISLKNHEGDFLERMERYRTKVESKKEALGYEFMAEQAPFRPNLSKNKSERSISRTPKPKSPSKPKPKANKVQVNKDKITKLKNILSQTKPAPTANRFEDSDEFDHTLILQNAESDDLLEGVQDQFDTNRPFSESVLSENAFRNNLNSVSSYKKVNLRQAKPNPTAYPKSNDQKEKSSRSRSAPKSPARQSVNAPKVSLSRLELNGGYHPSIRGILMKPF